MILTCFFFLGMVIAPREEKHVSDGIWTEAVIASTPAERPKTLMVDLLMPSTGELRRCYINKDEHSQQLRLGDDITVRLHDERFVGANDWNLGGEAYSRLNMWQRARLNALSWRQEAVRLLYGDNYGKACDETYGDAQAVAAAMTLGDKSALRSDTREVYAKSGASHVLALSGLHLGIIFMLLSLLTLGRRRSWLTQVVVIVAIWAFALLTGLSNSVTRAAIMITVYAAFAVGGRRKAPLGVLSFTAMAMLLADSSALFNVGFQLSFMAMLGILLFMPVFNGYVSAAWMQRHIVAKWLFGLVAVSVAAQLGTAPLVMLHFGRFSTWFLLTNIIVIPFATLIIYCAFLSLIIPAATTLVLHLTTWMNSMLEWISRLPMASIEGLNPSMPQVVLMYALTGTLYLLAVRLMPVRR
jgi:competence protein ComEC